MKAKRVKSDKGVNWLNKSVRKPLPKPSFRMPDKTKYNRKKKRRDDE